MADFEGRTDVISSNGAGAVATVSPGEAPDDHDGYVLRSLTEPDEEELVDAVLTDAFGIEGLAGGPPEYSIFEPRRNVLVEYRGEPVANVAALTRQLAVPGGLIPAAHLTRGAVRQAHRRRRLMSRLMHHHLRAARDVHAEPVAVWWASEARIYQRYQCGMASQNVRLAINNREVRVVDPPTGVPLREAVPGQIVGQLREVYDRVLPSRPGWSSRSEAVWRQLVDDPPPPFRQGWSAKRALLVEGDAGPTGYAIWQRRQQWSGDIRDGEVNVVELVASTPEAYAALWNFLLSVDLTRTVHWDFVADDEPLRLIVNEPRSLNPTISDGLWLRVLDVPAALTARRYAADLDTVLSVSDALLGENNGHWRLTIREGQATCTRTDESADLHCDISVLGATYLGGTSWGALGAAGRVMVRRTEALAAADAAFGWPVSPSTLGLF